MLSTLRMANISYADAEQFSSSQVELCEALLDMSSERVDEAVITEPADVDLEQVSLIKYVLSARILRWNSCMLSIIKPVKWRKNVSLQSIHAMQRAALITVSWYFIKY